MRKYVSLSGAMLLGNALGKMQVPRHETAAYHGHNVEPVDDYYSIRSHRDYSPHYDSPRDYDVYSHRDYDVYSPHDYSPRDHTYYSPRVEDYYHSPKDNAYYTRGDTYTTYEEIDSQGTSPRTPYVRNSNYQWEY